MISFNEANGRLWSKLGQRAAFGAIAAPAIIERNARTVFMVADVAASAALDRLAATHPDHLLNLGISEQNMIGVATGLCSQGALPFVASFAPFITARCADQLRMCAGYMSFPLKIVALASGLAMGINGPSHLGLEDIAIMRELPGIAILAPADASEAIQAALACLEWDGPVYLRLTGVPGDPSLPVQPDYAIGRARILREGRDITLLANGSIASECLKAADILMEKGIDAQVVNMRSIQPLDEDLLRAACETRLIFTVEEHFTKGGLGSAVAEFLASHGSHPPLVRLGLQAFPKAAPYKAVLEACGLNAEGISASVCKGLEKTWRQTGSHQ